jgi:hypothetical protein
MILRKSLDEFEWYSNLAPSISLEIGFAPSFVGLPRLLLAASPPTG